MSSGISGLLPILGNYSSQQRIISATLLSGPGATSYFDQPVSSAAFTSKLEKHLDDVKKGRGYLSSGVDKDLALKSFNSGTILANSNPSASRQYAGYLTGLSYDAKARFVNGVNGAAELSSQLTKTA